MESEPPHPSSPQPERHGCLLAYLIFMILANSLTLLAYGMMTLHLVPVPPNAFPGMPIVFDIFGLLNVIFAIAILGWRKWGFYGFCATAVIIFGLNLVLGINPIFAFAGLIGPAVLYGVLQIGGDRKGWNYLR